MRRSDWASERVRSWPNMWQHGMGSPAIIAENALGLAADMEAWARREFPGQQADEIPELIRKEVAELEAAIQTLRFMKEAPNSPSAETAAYALGLTLLANGEARKEAADVAIFAMRAILLLGGDPLEVIWEKWQEVRTRTYRKVQPETLADALPEQSTGNAEEIAWYVITWGEAYLSDELDGGVGHWTKSRDHALAKRDFREMMEVFERIVIIGDGPPERLVDLPGAALRGFTREWKQVREVTR